MVELIKQAWCWITTEHEQECSDIYSGTMFEVNAWCKHCGKPM